MLFDRITLNPKDILEKDFPVDTRGFRPQEVDKFLDIVIKDYNNFIALVKQKEADNRVLIEENLQLKRENRILKENVEMFKNADIKVTNVDIVRRLSQLEKIVYGEE